MEKGSHVFVVKNYSRYRGIGVGNSLESEEFFVGGHGWTIRFYPDGKTIEAHKSKHVSLDVHLKSSTSNSVQILSELRVVDQSDEGGDHFYSTFNGENLPFACVSPGTSMGYRKFMTQEHLRALNMRKDLVRIRATIGVFPCLDENLPLFKLPNRRIWADYGRLLQTKQGADVFFKVQNHTFCAHKWIIDARCPALFLEDIDIPNIEPEIFEAMLWFVYTGMLLEDKLDDSDCGPSSFIGKLLVAADRFEVKKLKTICESRISEKICGESIAYLLHLSQLSHAKELKAACLRFEAENGTDLLDVVGSDGREYLKQTCPLLFVELSCKASGNGRWDHNLSRKIFLTMKRMLLPQLMIDDRKKLM